ncbi:hypothetical protein, partial [Erwinia amylovora]|uniref:hypothetical protein n=1 Tax=Erwinia amylovora TaxID=552 RepID=UPI0020C08E89
MLLLYTAGYSVLASDSVTVVLSPALFSPMTMLIAGFNGKYSLRIWSVFSFGNRSFGGHVTEIRLCGEL